VTPTRPEPTPRIIAEFVRGELGSRHGVSAVCGPCCLRGPEAVFSRLIRSYLADAVDRELPQM
jgi:hypothetical protein